MVKTNPYELYENASKKQIAQATRRLTRAIKRKSWKEVERVQLMYKSLGADDTATRDMLVEKWIKVHGSKPRGFW